MMQTADRQVLFDVGDEVWFSARGKIRLSGLIKKLNPTRAKVLRGADVWVVRYGALNHVCAATAQEREKRALRLGEVAARARELMARNELADWSLRFNGARKKLGLCHYGDKSIVLSREHALEGTPEQIADTILHEIAHALAGPGAGHGPAWKAVARRLGATPKSCAPESELARAKREAAKAKFRTGDTVNFKSRGQLRAGVIERMNPKRAKVRSLGAVWSVPYARLEPNDLI